MDTTASSLLRELNDEQRLAVTYPDESVLVLAGAGSGKTRVLTTRIAWLLHTGHASADSILAVTFTNKAAKEMGGRLTAMLGQSVRSMWLGTFHGLCHRFLRLHHVAAALPANFRILDIGDQAGMIKHLLRESNIDAELLSPKSAQNFINARKEAGERPENLTANNPFTRRLIEIYVEYERCCRREGLVDFAELMLRCHEVLRDDESLRRHYQGRFTHILADEFQDTNALQYRWLKLLAGGGASLFAVGDDDQSIYRFRGAEPGNMAAMMRDFGIAEPIKLEQNYRSAGIILRAANALIAHNRDRLGKNLRTDAESGEKIRFYHAFDDRSEAATTVEEIKQLLRSGSDPGQIAVLYRNNAQSRILEQELFAQSLPYRIYGGLRFYERQEIKHALAYLSLATRGDDDRSFLRIVNLPGRGIGPRTVERIVAIARERGISLFAGARILAETMPKIAAFVRLIDTVAAYAAGKTLPETVALTLEESGLTAMYAAKKSDRERLDNLRELLNAAALFRPEEEFVIANNPSPEETLAAFLAHASLEAGDRTSENEAAVQLMTVHAAKGLEFDSVFLTGLEEGVFPNVYALDEVGGLEEERRLMYVALTRAKKRLYLSAAQKRMINGQLRIAPLSRFVGEIPRPLLSVLSDSPDIAPESAETKSSSREGRVGAGFAEGDNVRHASFGTGVIIAVEDKGNDLNLHINFGRNGIKILSVRFAGDKLSRL